MKKRPNSYTENKRLDATPQYHPNDSQERVISQNAMGVSGRSFG